LTCAWSILWPSITGNSPRRTVSTSGSSGIWFLKVEALAHTAYKVDDAKEGQAPMNEHSTTHFGYQTVNEDEKAGMVHGVFTRVASKYDIMNDLMSAGIHRLWKEAMMDWLNPRPGQRLLDVAGGTGDVAFRVAEAGGPQTQVTILDINGEMLRVGEERAAQRPYRDQLRFVEANAEELPLPEKTFDAYTIAFGIRNVPRIELALTEAYRVLKRGGRFLCLEFSSVDIPGLDKIYESYSFTAIPAMGKVITGDGHPYRYLVESIRKFPHPEVFRDMIEEAGFKRASYTRLTGGVVAIHSGWKL
jgi:demethylmenaquinone methyltransferase/2-methoxy-6-polyprenyl-1,4-benzoquinol methylase